MGRNNKYTKEQKIKAIKDYKSGRRSVRQIATDLEAGLTTIKNWLFQYELYGEKIFDNKPRNQSYSKEFKNEIINDYLSKKYSYSDLAKKYKIFSQSNIERWIKEYNNSGTLKDYNPKAEVYTMKARKTTYEERVEIVNYCISHDNDYKGTADKYSLPYSLVYQWVVKYNKTGYDGLKYQKKGPHPKEEIIPTTPEEKLQAELEKLKRENERLRFENEVLKKKKYFEEHLN